MFYLFSSFFFKFSKLGEKWLCFSHTNLFSYSAGQKADILVTIMLRHTLTGHWLQSCWIHENKLLKNTIDLKSELCNNNSKRHAHVHSFGVWNKSDHFEAGSWTNLCLNEFNKILGQLSSKTINVSSGCWGFWTYLGVWFHLTNDNKHLVWHTDDGWMDGMWWKVLLKKKDRAWRNWKDT